MQDIFWRGRPIRVNCGKITLMRRLLTVTLLALLFWQSASALDASVSYAVFKSSEKPYIEVYLHIVGSTSTFAKVNDSLYQARVEVLILFERDSQVVKFDKFQLNSPMTANPLDFVDLKRYALDSGEYQFSVEISDMNRKGNARTYQTIVEVDFNGGSVEQSDIALLARVEKSQEASAFQKNGYIMEPAPYNFLGKGVDKLTFYQEIYHTDQYLPEDFVLTYTIEAVQNGETKTMLIGHKKHSPAEVIPVLMQLDISKIPSGNYYLALEIRDRYKKLISRKQVFFQRSNPYLWQSEEELAATDISNEFVQQLTPEELEFGLRALGPKIPQTDVEAVNMMLQAKNANAQRMYLFTYWTQRYPANPEQGYKAYMEVAKAVNNLFESGFRHGFETDRGYVFLKYGRPDDIEQQEEEPSAPPYEIWTYNNFPATGQSNVKFIFYNRSLAPGDYRLLHSNARGELNNPQWQQELYRNALGENRSGDYLEGSDAADGYNRNAGRLWKN